MYRKILYEMRDGVARITLNRPDKRNALDGEIVAELKAAFSASAADDACRVVLLTGAGTDFCSGADLANLGKTVQNSLLDNMTDARATADLSRPGIRVISASAPFLLIRTAGNRIPGSGSKIQNSADQIPFSSCPIFSPFMRGNGCGHPSRSRKKARSESGLS